MPLEVRRAVTFGAGVTGWGVLKGAFWGTGYLLFLDQGAGYTRVSFVKLHQVLHL